MNRLHAVPFVMVAALGAAMTVPAFGQGTPVQSQPRPAPASPAQAAQPPVVVYQSPENARDVQQRLREILDAYPPTLRQLIRLDPTLMQRDDYMAAYPALTAFLQQHPEIQRNPSFYFGEQYFEREQTDRQRTLNVIDGALTGVAVLIGFLTVITLLYSLLRQALEYRRWRRQIQIQTDIHTKLLDRMTNNQELLAYIETSAGRRFLEAPVPLLAQTPAASIAPVARILWSVQIGIVVVAVGVGFWVARGTVSDPDLMGVFEVMGSLAMAVGIGFVISALASWLLSQRMGLMNAAMPKAE